MSPTSPKPENDNSMVDGASEAEAARKVKFERRPDAQPGGGHAAKDDPSDASDELGPKGKPGVDKGPPAPDAIALEELSSENDDGAG